MRSFWGNDGPGCLIAPNFSIGAVLMMRFAEMAAPHFTGIEIIERHHHDKPDAPSGTSLATAARIAVAGGSSIEESGELVTGSRGAIVDGPQVSDLSRCSSPHRRITLGAPRRNLPRISEDRIVVPDPCRWGILGTAGIARKNWQALKLAGNAAVTAVASRSLDRSRQFVADCQAACPLSEAPTALGSYDELLRRDDVDAVYVPLPTGVRKEWVIRAAETGKHVLVEKPVGVTADDVRDMLAACERHRVQLMDGVMFMHSRRLDALRQALDDGESVGRIRRIVAQFSFDAAEGFVAENIRADSRLEPHGCLGDLGWYTIRFALWVMKFEMPTRVTARRLAEAGRPGNPEKVPFEMSGEMLFPGGASASFYCSFQTANEQWASVSGAKGVLHVPDFVLPFFGDEVRFDVTNSAFEVAGCDFDMQRRTRSVVVSEYSNSHPTSQEANLFRTFSALVTSGRLDPRWGEMALKTQLVIDACVRSAREGRTIEIE